MKFKRVFSLALAVLLVLGALGMTSCGKKEKLYSPEDPAAVTIWNYYTGPRQTEFNELVTKFNETVGLEKGIVVEAQSFGSISDLTDSLIASAKKEAGSSKMPDIFTAYADTVYEVEKVMPVADVAKYFSKEEKSAFVSSYLEAGDLRGDGGIVIVPTAKSTELLYVNEIAWDKFAAATGADKSLLSTWEGLAVLGEEYYNWTDSLTPAANDGKAFFGRDSMSNYMLVGSFQMGHDIFTVKDGKVLADMDEETMRRLWDNYYVPFIKGCYCASGKFRSDDMKMGNLIAFVGSSSGASYFPDSITNPDGTAEKAVAGVYPVPQFEGCEKTAVQQGAGMAVIQSDERQESASVEFIKWFTALDQNLSFSVKSGYLPVTVEANNEELLVNFAEELGSSQATIKTLITAPPMIEEYTLYSGKAFENAYALRKVLDYSIQDAINVALVSKNLLMESGLSSREAAARLTTDEAFNKWFTDFKAAVAKEMVEE